MVVVMRSKAVDSGATAAVMMGCGDREVSQRGRIGDLTVERDGGRLMLVGVGRERRWRIGAVWMKGFSGGDGGGDDGGWCPMRRRENRMSKLLTVLTKLPLAFLKWTKLSQNN